MSEEVDDKKPEEVTATAKLPPVKEPTVQEAIDEEADLADLLAGKEDTDAILDAVKELTKIVGTLSKDLKQHMTAGKF